MANKIRETLRAGSPGQKLTAAQRRAAELFATNDVRAYRIEDIAKEVGCSIRTLYRWKENPHWIAYQNEIAERSMEGFLAETYNTLRHIVRQGRSDHAKLKGVELVLKNRGKLQEVQKIEATIKDERSDEEIEAEIAELQRQLAEINEGYSFEDEDDLDEEIQE